MDTGNLSAGEASAAAMVARLDSQRAAFLADGAVPEAVRRDRLNRAMALLDRHQDRFVDAMAEDFQGRPKLMSLFTDLATPMSALRFAKAHLKGWMRPERRPVEFPLGLLGARARVEYQPKGVVGVVSPWNFPVNLTFGPLAGILAAGNRVMIKPSEITPATSEAMAAAVADYFDADEIDLFTGGPDVGKAFSHLAFDHLLFTGATEVGRHVMRAAADNLVPVTLELGGKSPVLVTDSADLGLTARRVVAGKMLNAGQICLAPDYVLVPRAHEAALADALIGAAEALYGDALANPDYTSIVNARHRDRILDYLDDAEARGARLRVAGGGSARGGQNATALPFTLVQEVQDQMAVMREEIFGPVLPLVPYDRLDDAIAYINARPRPLALYHFGTDPAETRRVLDHTRSGGVTVNDVIFHVAQESLPFGGIGPSGMGVYHGVDGFRTFSHARAVYHQPKVDVMGLLGAVPPYGAKLRRAMKIKMRR
ncbi:coniferyl aldehyde dehydrogenase [Rhodothalassium salexigens]|uniref:coniferyl aldehyde dehydrogenase n=1 Tax=Rhodothalassium salexigens TaxID=1086 RepID=UPI0019149C3E|nr:coniferyl aldehyde dehydrogenase [Rhodothalassium salexigens]MBK5910075.1 coniferyl aldehyde dehydrogenase [Rhodothalassium salexigens]MBK5921758.1 coniferyl aldehyde dehydrogenase [Rhodothalassium salexigens]